MTPEKEEVAAVVIAKHRCIAVIDKINVLGPSSKISDSCKRTLLRLANSEFNFLSRISSLTLSQSRSLNIGYLEAVIYIIQQPCVTGVSCVCKSVLPTSIGGNDEMNGLTKCVHVDIMCTFNGRPVWFIVSDGNPNHVSWFASSRCKGLRERVKQLVDAAHSCSTLKPSSVIFFFARGINSEVRMKFKEEYETFVIGAGFSCFDFSSSEEVESDWVTVLARSFRAATALEIKIDRVRDAPVSVDHTDNDSISDDSLLSLGKQTMLLGLGDSFSRLQSSMELLPTSRQNAESTIPEDVCGSMFVNFDTTALIAIVSGISNGGSEKLLSMPKETLMQRFKSNYDFVLAQIKSESESPLLLKLTSTLSGKRGIICKSVFMEFKELVSMVGGKMENFRADELLRHMMIVLDHPSERVAGLPTTRKLAFKSKIVFGTGDYWQSPTLTANMGFVRAVSQTDRFVSSTETVMPQMDNPKALVHSIQFNQTKYIVAKRDINFKNSLDLKVLTEATIMADFSANFQSLKLQYPFLDFDPNMEQLLEQFTQPNLECSNPTFFSQSQTTEFQGKFVSSFPPGIFPQSEEPLVTATIAPTCRIEEKEGDCMRKRKAVEMSEGSSGVSSSLVVTSAKNNRKGKKAKVCRVDEMPKDVVHVRARRGQATDSHSLAERVRRGKINERLKCLQDIVPGCYKTMGMAVMLDEIINYVQSLQNQVEFLSMRLTAASTFHDFNTEPDQTIESLQRAKAAEMEKLIKDMNAGIACFQQQIWPQ